MTRQIFILLVSIFLVIFGGIWETKYLEQSANYVLSDIEYTENMLNNNNMEMAKEEIKLLENSWNNVKDSWNIFVQNDLVSNIDSSLVELKAYIEKEDKEAYIVLKKLRANIQEVVTREKVNLENVF